MTMVVTAHDRLAGSILVLSQASPGWAPDGQTLPSGPCQARPEPVAMARFRDLQKMFSDCMRHRRALRPEMSAKHAPVAQLDRALDYESRGQEFESLRARQIYQALSLDRDVPRGSKSVIGYTLGRTRIGLIPRDFQKALRG